MRGSSKSSDIDFRAYRLGQYFVKLTGNDRCQAIRVKEDFWDRGIAALPPGRLVSLIESTEDWTSWERHPNVEEFILQLNGELELVLDNDGEQTSLLLRQSDFAIVPKGTWHTAKVPKGGSALYITPGDGTENRKRC